MSLMPLSFWNGVSVLINSLTSMSVDVVYNCGLILM